MDYRQGRQSSNVIDKRNPINLDMLQALIGMSWGNMQANADRDMRALTEYKPGEALMEASNITQRLQPEGNRFGASLPKLVSEAPADGPGWNTEIQDPDPTAYEVILPLHEDKITPISTEGDSTMNPFLLGLIAQGAGTNPEVFGPMLDQMNFPSPDTPEGMQLLTSITQPNTGIGESLLPGSGGGDPNLGPAGPMIDPNAAAQAATQQAPVGGTAPITGGEQVQQSPAQALQGAQQRGQTAPQVKGPTAPEPKFSGGVSGAAQPNKLGVPATVTPAQALMAALLGPQGSGGAGGQLPVPVLGQMMRR